MGLWKWPSILLLLFCIGVLYPYIMRSGGSNGIGPAAASAELHGCRVDYEVRNGEGAVTVLGRMAPRCAGALSPPTLALIDETGAAVAQAPMRGDPNSLRGRLETPDDFDTDHIRLTITSTDRNGAAAHIDATAFLTAQPSIAKQED